jgi:hypothetical protein
VTVTFASPPINIPPPDPSTELLDIMLPFNNRCAWSNTARGLTKFRENLLLCTSNLLLPTTHNTVSTPDIFRTHHTLLRLSTTLPRQTVTRQEDTFAALSLQLLVMATPEKFVL